MDEAHVQHAVGLVEHEETDRVERHVTLPDQVEQAARGGHQQVHALLERVDLRTLVDAAEDHAVAGCSGRSRGSTRRSGWPVRASG